MFLKLKNTLEEAGFDKKEIDHAFSIILRVSDEIDYMNSRNKNVSFELKQMQDFNTYYDTINICFIIKKDKIIVNKFELKMIVNDIYSFFKKEYPIDYDYKLIDPIYFSLFFYDLLGKIQKVEFDKVNVSKLRLLRRNSKSVPIEESECYRALINSKKNKIYTPFNSNHIIDSDINRLNSTLKSVEKYGYPHYDKMVILYNDEIYIRDGQHRAAVLKYLYGNIDIKVVRFYLIDNYFYP